MIEDVNDKKRNNQIKILIIIIIILVICLVVYITYVFMGPNKKESNSLNKSEEYKQNEEEPKHYSEEINNTNISNKTNNDTIYDNDESNYTKDVITYKIVEYDYKLTSKDKYYKPTTNHDGLFTMYENSKYDHSYYYDDDDTKYFEYIGLYEGKAVIFKNNKKTESKLNNIKSIHLMGTCGDSYHGELAILTSNGDIYISNLCDYSEYGSAQFDTKTFDKASKIESKNKYKDVAMVLRNYKYYEEEYGGDTFHYQFVGITEDGKLDLIEEYINDDPYGDPWNWDD